MKNNEVDHIISLANMCSDQVSQAIGAGKSANDAFIELEFKHRGYVSKGSTVALMERTPDLLTGIAVRYDSKTKTVTVRYKCIDILAFLVAVTGGRIEYNEDEGLVDNGNV